MDIAENIVVLKLTYLLPILAHTCNLGAGQQVFFGMSSEFSVPGSEFSKLWQTGNCRSFLGTYLSLLPPLLVLVSVDKGHVATYQDTF